MSPPSKHKGLNFNDFIDAITSPPSLALSHGTTNTVGGGGEREMRMEAQEVCNKILFNNQN